MNYMSVVVQQLKKEREHTQKQLQRIDEALAALGRSSNGTRKLSAADLAVCVETKSWLGLKMRQAGLLYSITEQEAVGRIVTGKRSTQGWTLEKAI